MVERVRGLFSVASIFIFREQLSIINFSSRTVKVEAHGAHKNPRVATFGVRQVLSTPKMQKEFHVHRAKPVGTR